ncbi:MAG: 4a-hydroxytetrahydrobiopterin dehydratase [Ignavibacteriaceae bacterium]
MALLDETGIQNKLKNFKGWDYSDKQIEKEYKLKDFVTALDFVNRIGKDAEAMNHHPDIFIHSYNKVKISISTHSEGGVTEKDFYLAKKIEEQNTK